MWSDVIGYVIRRTRQQPLMPGDTVGIEVFWNHVPLDQKRIIEEFVPLKIVEFNEQSTLTADLARSCTGLFHPAQDDVVRRLCVQLGYIRAEDSDALGVLRTDVNDDPLELFRPSKNDPQRSRYDTLFAENDDQSSSLRQLFFRNTLHNASGDQGQMMLHTLQSVVTSALQAHRQEQAASLEDVLVAVQAHRQEQAASLQDVLVAVQMCTVRYVCRSIPTH